MGLSSIAQVSCLDRNLSLKFHHTVATLLHAAVYWIDPEVLWLVSNLGLRRSFTVNLVLARKGTPHGCDTPGYTNHAEN